jgi:hypothetical protein
MAISTRRAGAARLRQAVDAYRAELKDKLDQHALALLDRLAGSPEAGKAFERLRPKDRPGVWPVSAQHAFLTLCIWVEQLARIYPARIRTERKMPARLKRLNKAVAELRLFVTEQTTPPSPSDLLTVWIGGRTPATAAAMTRGLDLIANLIETRRGIGKHYVTRLGATQKQEHPSAAKNAAIEILAKGVRLLTGKPNRLEVAELAQAILEIDVSIERVDQVLRSRKQQRWPLAVRWGNITPLRVAGDPA